MHQSPLMYKPPQNLAGECTACHQLNPLLFNVRHRGKLHRFCVPCVLKNHTGLFCPICFTVYDDTNPLPSSLRVICVVCSSVSHLSCVKSPPSSSTRYRCPPCSNSNFSYYDLSVSSNKCINEYGAKQMVAAGMISYLSMKKAEGVAWVEAEKKSRDAVLGRKSAKEGLENLGQVAAKKKAEASTVMDGSLQKLSQLNFGVSRLPFSWVQNQSSDAADGSGSSGINNGGDVSEALRKEPFNWYQNQSPAAADGSGPSGINNGVAVPETVRKEPFNWVQSQSPAADGPGPSRINDAVDVPESIRKESNGFH